jgi:hypothetical protein
MNNNDFSGVGAILPSRQTATWWTFENKILIFLLTIKGYLMMYFDIILYLSVSFKKISLEK